MAGDRRILVVEDEQIVAADLEQTLTDLGYKIVGSAESGEAAIEMAQQLQPDLVLMDIYLKGSINGIAAAEHINRLWHIPVVFLTANSSEEWLARASAAESYGYLLKPYRTPELDATISLALKRHELAQELFAKHEWLRNMLEGLSDGIIAAGSDGRVSFLNSVAEDLTGWRAHEAIGKDISEVFVLATFTGEPVKTCQLKYALSTRKAVGRRRFMLRKRERDQVPIEDSASPIFEGGKLVGAVAVFSDITNRLRREQESEAQKLKLEEEVHSTAEALGETRAELQALSAHLMIAQEEERRWLARELHDDFSQTTAGVEMQIARALDMVANENELRDLLLKIRGQISKLSIGLRSTSHRLHPSILDDLGLVSALRALMEDFCEKGGDGSIKLPQSFPDLPIDSATALYRIAQEALRNAIKHADGSHVRVTLSNGDDMVRLSVEDAGPGFDLNQVRQNGGLGLVSMNERARSAGGTLHLHTQPGEGTSIVVHVPLKPR